MKPTAAAELSSHFRTVCDGSVTKPLPMLPGKHYINPCRSSDRIWR